MNRNTYALALSALAVAINVLAGSIVANLKISWLFLDAVGTIFAAVLLGPWWALGVGILTNLVMGVTTGPNAIPFGLVNGAIGLTVGFIAKRYGFGWLTAVVTGIIISIVAPLIGTPIAVAMFGGLTGGGMDVFVLWLAKSGSSIFTAAFLPRITANLIDKILSSLLVAYVIMNLPKSILIKTNKKADRKHAA